MDHILSEQSRFPFREWMFGILVFVTTFFHIELLSRYNSPSCQGDIPAHSKIPCCFLCASSDGISISSPCLFITTRLALSWCGNVTLKPTWFFFYIKVLHVQLLLFKNIRLLSLFPSLFVIRTASWILRFFSRQCRPRNFLGRCWYFL